MRLIVVEAAPALRCGGANLGHSRLAQVAGLAKDVDEHLFGELAGEGVLQRRMVGGEEDAAVGHAVMGAMGEDVGGAADGVSVTLEVVKVAVEGDLAECDDHADVLQ